MTRKLELRTARPSDEHLLLLRAALLEGDSARDAYAAWIETHDPRAVDELSGRLLPGLYRNLERAGITDEHSAYLKDVWRQAWATNATLFHAAGDAIRILSEADIPAVLTKGSALVAHGSTPDLGTRVMADVDALVPYAQADAAHDALTRNGWRLHSPRGWQQERQRGHSTAFEDDKGRQLDLHWRAVFDPADDTALLSRREHAVLLGNDVWVPSAADQLVLTCLHGVGWHGAAHRWIIDSVQILQHHDVDWDVVMSEARSRQASHRIATQLELLAELMDAPVPQRVITDLRSDPLTLEQRLLQRAKDSSHWGNTIYLCSIDHARRSRQLGVREPWMSFAMIDLGLESNRQLAKRVATRPFRHLRWIARGRTWA